MTMLRDLHFEHNHEGIEYVRSVIQQKFWIIGLRNALRSVKISCVFCRKIRAQHKTPFMADLPSERLDYQSYPFTNVGVDYFGPFEVKLFRRSMKRWCCLFTCLATRAVHIEVVRSLDTDSCLVAINRLLTGKPTTIISDNGTNFVGSARELKEYINSWNQDEITSELAEKHLVWKFNPPGAPHFGGVWERLVRSYKKAMVTILGNRSLTDEVLLTTMCLVEQTLNAPPITPASDDPEDLEALAPNHFIIGRANVCIPFIPNAEVYSNHRKMFRSSQAYADIIWNRWVKEYLPENNVRAQWNKLEPNVQVGDLVWLIEDDVRRSHYKMARVMEVCPGKDGIVRSALIKTVDGTLKRPVVKLAPLFEKRFRAKDWAGIVGASKFVPKN